MRESRLIACVSVVPGNGAKYTGTLMANELRKKHPKSTIALVDFDLINPYLFAKQTQNDRVHGIDNIIDKISAELLTQELFRENMIKIEGQFDLLKGTSKLGRENLILRLHILKIIEFLRADYDYIVMIVNAPMKANAGTLHGLYAADEIVLVTRPNFMNLESFESAIKECQKYRNSVDIPVSIIYNMRGVKDGLEDFSYFTTEENAQILGYLTYEENTVDNQNLGGNVRTDVARKLSRKAGLKSSSANENRIAVALDILLNKKEAEKVL